MVSISSHIDHQEICIGDTKGRKDGWETSGRARDGEKEEGGKGAQKGSFQFFEIFTHHIKLSYIIINN